MALPPGTRLGPYEVSALLGEGGMGQVYRARDTKLDRDAALKILPESFANDPDRLMRFEREARTLAALNHPNIAAIYGIEDRALVMELVEGEDLSARIARGPIPLDEALPIAKQIADALEAAHDQGIIHRDLKPANVKVREDGTVKVLDFGLAKAIDRLDGNGFSGRRDDVANSPTITSPAMTMQGVILGTAAYMSPEQAKGKAVDKRADVWAFGCVFFEMLTGKRTFKGNDVTDIITSVMRDTPEWTALPAQTPLAIRTLLRRCLEKDPRHRAPHMAIARMEIADAMTSTGELIGAPATTPHRSAWPLALGVGAATAIAAAAIMWSLPRPSIAAATDSPVLRYSIDTPGGSTGIAVSPDGRFVAVMGRATDGGFRRLWLRPLDGTEFVEVPGSVGTALTSWSPDSAEIAFIVGRRLMRWRIGGGAAQPGADLTSIYPGAAEIGGALSWQPDGSILIGAPDGLYRLASSGGAAVRLIGDETSVGGAKPLTYTWPQSVPDTQALFYAHLIAGVGDAGALLYRPSPGGASSVLINSRSRAQVTRQRLLVARSTGQFQTVALSAHAFDAATATLSMPGIVLAPEASFDFSASDNGVLVYRPRSSGIPYRFEWVDSNGKPIGDGFDTVDAGPFNLSLDGSLLAYAEGSGIVVRDLSRGVSTRLVEDGAAEPILSPDGRQIAYATPSSAPPAVVVQPSSGGTRRIVVQSERVGLPEDWSADGKYLAVNQRNLGLLVPVDGSHPPIPYVEQRLGSVVDESRFSPDGQWMLYNSTDTGRSEVYVMPLPPTGERWQLSPSGGAQGRWRSDGRTVFYLSLNGDLMALDLTLTPGQRPRISAPRKLFASGLEISLNVDQYAPNRDGTRFLLRRRQTSRSTEQLHVIVNWPSLVNAGGAK